MTTRATIENDLRVLIEAMNLMAPDEAWMTGYAPSSGDLAGLANYVTRKMAESADAELEACAKIADHQADPGSNECYLPNDPADEAWIGAAEEIAKAIRARAAT